MHLQIQMHMDKRIERSLKRAVAYATNSGQPPKIGQALKWGIFPGGARIRPRLCLAVSLACGDENPAATDAAGAAFELMHCASLVHDDMPCFDNADMRRGKLTVHKKFSEPLALLTGDAMIILAFETIARECALTPHLIAPLIGIVGQSSGMPHGIVAGQAWESEANIPLDEYHRAKTASLFTGATMAGAIAAGANPQQWRAMADNLGAAYQVADDLRDFVLTQEELGKPAGQDDAHGRPNSVHSIGLSATVDKLYKLVNASKDAVPDCKGAPMLRQLIEGEAKRLVPKGLAKQSAA